MVNKTKRRLAAILAADVAGYTRLVEQDTDGTVAAWAAARDDIVKPMVDEKSGHIIKFTGDGFLVEFPSVQDAVLCAITMQEQLKSSPLDFRMGINVGDIVDDGGDVHGEGVNIAARLEALAETGGICISGDVYNQVRNRIEAEFRDMGEKEIKHVSQPIRVYAIGESERGVTGNPFPELPDKTSIAVLPFDNMSGDPDQEYFADGITEDIITELSKISGLVVISRNSTFTFKGKPTKVQDVCRDLGAHYIMEGSVRKVGQQVRITAQLIDGTSGGHLWAERYDRGLADIFAVQDDVTEKIVRALEINLVTNAQNRPARVETDIPEAYDFVLRGREQFRLYSKDSNLNAARFYQKAIEIDPNYAAAYAGLAMTCLHEWFKGSPDALERAYEWALRANALDSSSPLVYEALGNIQLFRKQHSEAIIVLQRWVKIEPGNADAYANLSGILIFSGELEQVIPLLEKAMILNPYYPFYYLLYQGMAYLAMERYEQALEAIKRSAARHPDTHAQLYLAACYGLLGKDVEAREALAEVYRIYPEFSIVWLRTHSPYKRAKDLNRLISGLRKAGVTETD